jgi:DNA (cytosine-5)-methyltransferase 1
LACTRPGEGGDKWESFQRQTVKGDLRDYELIPHVLNAADFGAAQIRKRAVVIGRHRDMPRPPAPRPTITHPSMRRTVGDALAPLSRRAGTGDLPKRSITTAAGPIAGTYLTGDKVQGLLEHVLPEVRRFGRLAGS